MGKLTKEEFSTLVDLLEKVAPKPRFIQASVGIEEPKDIVEAIIKMKENVMPKIDRFITPWTYEILDSAGLWDERYTKI